MEDYKEAKQCSDMTYLCFLAEEVFLQICHYFNGHIQYPFMISPENVNLDKTKLKTLINFKFKF